MKKSKVNDPCFCGSGKKYKKCCKDKKSSELYKSSERLSIKARLFENVIADVKKATYALVRGRVNKTNEEVNWTSLGSGFFVSGKHFLTCTHVINPKDNPHQDGDIYWMLQQSDTPGLYERYQVKNVVLGKQLFLQEEKDAALIVIDNMPDIQKKKNGLLQFAAISYDPILDGRAIGVLGYPLSKISFENRNIDKPILNSFVPRTSKGVVSCQPHYTNIQVDGGRMVLKDIDVIEVDFLFVPGNSGGPVFDAETGKIVGFVHGYSSILISYKLTQIDPKKLSLPEDAPSKFIDTEKAIYSKAIQISNIRDFLEKHGVDSV